MIDFYEMSPVEKHGDIWFKREDLFQPFKDFGIVGGKVRQCLALVENNKELIAKEYNSTIATAAQVGSPQNPIVARVAREFGFNSIIGIGGTKMVKEKVVEKHRILKSCQEQGSEIIVIAKQGFSNVLYPNLEKIRKTRQFFTILFGYQVKENRDAVVNVIAHQVKNIPEEIETLVVNCGSANTLIGILTGLMKFKRKLRVVAIQPFGYNREEFINDNVEGVKGIDYEYEYHSGDFSYHKHIEYEISEGFELDTVYESKAYLQMRLQRIVNPKKENVCFWVIGNANNLR